MQPVLGLRKRSWTAEGTSSAFTSTRLLGPESGTATRRSIFFYFFVSNHEEKEKKVKGRKRKGQKKRKEKKNGAAAVRSPLCRCCFGPRFHERHFGGRGRGGAGRASGNLFPSFPDSASHSSHVISPLRLSGFGRRLVPPLLFKRRKRPFLPSFFRGLSFR